MCARILGILGFMFTGIPRRALDYHNKRSILPSFINPQERLTKTVYMLVAS